MPGGGSPSPVAVDVSISFRIGRSMATDEAEGRRKEAAKDFEMKGADWRCQRMRRHAYAWFHMQFVFA